MARCKRSDANNMCTAVVALRGARKRGKGKHQLAWTGKKSTKKKKNFQKKNKIIYKRKNSRREAVRKTRRQKAGRTREFFREVSKLREKKTGART